MDIESLSTPERLREAIVAAFPGYVQMRLRQLGVPDDDVVVATIEAAIVGATARLDSQLAILGDASLAESPLEMVRIATESITSALRAQGVTAIARDARSIELHPDDDYGLYPATSRDLGEEVWRIHMEWGIERARLVGGMVPAPPPQAKTDGSTMQGRATSSSTSLPSIALFGMDRGIRDQVAAAAADLGYLVLLWRNPAALENGLAAPPVAVIVDLDHPAARDAVRQAASATRVVAIGRSVDDMAEAAVMALGAEAVVDSDRILDRLGGFLPRLA